jgi:septal ring factor EnvC (AmiA/AmiB activator)
MMPKRVLVDDMGRELGVLVADLVDVRKRLNATQRQIEAQRKVLATLRKRLDRQAKRPKPPPAGLKPCCPLRSV